MNNIMAIIKLLLTIALDIVDVIRRRKDKAGDVKLKDLPNWRKWRRRALSPDFSKLLEKFRKLQK